MRMLFQCDWAIIGEACRLLKNGTCRLFRYSSVFSSDFQYDSRAEKLAYSSAVALKILVRPRWWSLEKVLSFAQRILLQHDFFHFQGWLVKQSCCRHALCASSLALYASKKRLIRYWRSRPLARRQIALLPKFLSLSRIYRNCRLLIIPKALPNLSWMYVYLILFLSNVESYLKIGSVFLDCYVVGSEKISLIPKLWKATSQNWSVRRLLTESYWRTFPRESFSMQGRWRWFVH